MYNVRGLTSFRPIRGDIIAKYLTDSFSMFSKINPIELYTKEQCEEAGIKAYWGDYAKDDELMFVTKYETQASDKLYSAISDFEAGYNFLAERQGLPRLHQLDK